MNLGNLYIIHYLTPRQIAHEVAYHEHIIESCGGRTVEDVGHVPATPQVLAGDELVTGRGVGKKGLPGQLG